MSASPEHDSEGPTAITIEFAGSDIEIPPPDPCLGCDGVTRLDTVTYMYRSALANVSTRAPGYRCDSCGAEYGDENVHRRFVIQASQALRNGIVSEAAFCKAVSASR